MNRIQRVLSMESNDDAVIFVDDDGGKTVIDVPPVNPEVTEDEVDEAIVDIIDADDEESELAEDDMTGNDMAQLDQVQESLEAHIDICRHALDKGIYAPQYVSSLQVAVEHYSLMFGEELNQQKASLENYTADNLNEYYSFALESFSGWLTRVVTAPDRALNNAIKRVQVRNGLTQRKAKALNTQADALLKRIGEADNASADYSMSKADVKLFNGTKLTAALASDQKGVNWVIDGYMRSAYQFGDKLIDASTQIVNRPNQNHKAALDSAASMTHPDHTIPNAYTSAGSLLNNEFFAPNKEFKVEGDTAAKLKSMRKGTGIDLVQGKSNASVQSITLTKADLTAIAKAAKVYAQLMSKASEMASKELSAQEGRVSRNLRASKQAQELSGLGAAINAANSYEAKAAQELGSLIIRSTQLAESSRFLAVQMASDRSGRLLSFASRAVKVLEKKEKASTATTGQMATA